MDSSNRIQTTSIVTTVARQTPKRDFGDELVNVMGEGARIGAGILGSAVNGAPVVSAAVSGISGAVSAVTSITGAHSTSSTGAAMTSGLTPLGTANGGNVSSGTTALEHGGSMDSLSRQEAMNHESQAFSAMYLQLQNQMQQESRQFNAISNIIKVRHDSAKAAINNIR